jgi:hypothetical protein
MKRLINLTLFCSFLLGACSKSNNVTSDVWLRIENATSIALEDIKVGNTGYGNAAAGEITGYIRMSEPVYAGYCIFQIQGRQSGAGYGICGTPMPPPFEPGILYI